MNPATRIWITALLLCIAGIAVYAIIAPSPSSAILGIYIIMVVASLVSLLGFHLFFTGMSRMRPAPALLWMLSLIAVPLIVALNSLLLLAFLAFLFHQSSAIIEIFIELWPFTAVPAAAAMLATGIHHRRISSFAKTSNTILL